MSVVWKMTVVRWNAVTIDEHLTVVVRNASGWKKDARMLDAWIKNVTRSAG